jgi:hypothetical protein
MSPLAPDLSRELRAEPVPSKPHRFVADVDAPQRQRIIDVHHHGQADDLGRRLEVPERTLYAHPVRLGDRPARLNQFSSDSASRRLRDGSGRVEHLQDWRMIGPDSPATGPSDDLTLRLA